MDSLEATSESVVDMKPLLNQVLSEENGEVFEVGVGSDEGLKGTLEMDPHLSWMWSQITSPQQMASAN